jgi:hypothetical protein
LSKKTLLRDNDAEENKAGEDAAGRDDGDDDGMILPID